MPPARPWVLLAAAAAAVALAACGDDGATAADAAVDGPTRPFVRPTPVAVPLSATGPDQLQAAAAGPAGSVYAAGFAAAGPAAPRFVVVVKLTAAGALDPSFGGGDGVATRRRACGEDRADRDQQAVRGRAHGSGTTSA